MISTYLSLQNLTIVLVASSMYIAPKQADDIYNLGWFNTKVTLKKKNKSWPPFYQCLVPYNNMLRVKWSWSLAVFYSGNKLHDVTGHPRLNMQTGLRLLMTHVQSSSRCIARTLFHGSHSTNFPPDAHQIVFDWKRCKVWKFTRI